MNTIIITGTKGLIGCEAQRFFLRKCGYHVVSLNNFTGEKLSEACFDDSLRKITFVEKNLRNQESINRLFSNYSLDISLVIHNLCQPLHDPVDQKLYKEYDHNVKSTRNILNSLVKYCPDAVFILSSSNSVYKEPRLDLAETATRWDLLPKEEHYSGIDELFPLNEGCLSVASSIVEVEKITESYRVDRGIKTGIFRLGLSSGPSIFEEYKNTIYFGVLARIMATAVKNEIFKIFSHNGKQVRDNIHSYDIVNAYYHFYKNFKTSGIYNLGGGRNNSFSLLEAFDLAEKKSGEKIKFEDNSQNSEDSKWWITDNSKFKNDFPEWDLSFSLNDILEGMRNT